MAGVLREEICVLREKFLPARRYRTEKSESCRRAACGRSSWPCRRIGVIAERQAQRVQAVRTVGGHAERVDVGHA